MANHIAHIWWLPYPQTPHKAATKRVQFFPPHDETSNPIADLTF